MLGTLEGKGSCSGVLVMPTSGSFLAARSRQPVGKGRGSSVLVNH